MKAHSQSFFSLMMVAVMASTANAAIDNGGFETGDFTPWTTYEDIYAVAWFGGIQVLTSHLVTSPDAGNYFAKLPANSNISQGLT
jgi:hypothetical protein